MLFEERLEAAERRKVEGNALFADGKYKEALAKYALVRHLGPLPVEIGRWDQHHHPAAAAVSSLHMAKLQHCAGMALYGRM